ncbi:MAG: single-stranded-DNA-specific exonuclease RecJ [Phycisphaeraceae bacterium]|nr:single-stranded-DNA-specific exonuclease RecJ [Phycisphaeraceae bacterium]
MQEISEQGLCSRWRLKPAPEPSAVGELAEKGVMSPLLASLLLLRGVSGPDVEPFLRPRLSALHDPADLPNIESAADAILAAIENDRPIIVYGDYDVDGVCGAAVLWHMLKALGGQVQTYVPHRVEEGYGVNEEALRQFAQDSPGALVITVDCGVTATGPAALAKELGLELIITDHHTPDPDGLPDATVVHPGLPESAYPWADLCGAGVAYKLAWEVARRRHGERLPEALRTHLVDLLSLVALATVADVVPLADENRVITHYGLGRVKQTDLDGLNALIEVSRLADATIDAYDVGFKLGPRLNASGRMGHAAEAVELLTSARGERAVELAKVLDRANNERRKIQKEVLEAACEQVEAQGQNEDDHRVIVVADADWHPGVVGIVAGRLREQYDRPAVVLAIDGDTATGSARSIDGVSIHEALAQCQDHLQRWGGHAMADGVTLATEDIDPFREALVVAINDRLAVEDLVTTIVVDAECNLSQTDLPAVEQIQRMKPFGRANPTPRLLVRSATVRNPRRVGSHGTHLNLTLEQDGARMRGIGFGLGDLIEHTPAGAVVDAVFKPSINEFRGRRSAEMILEDLRPSSS